SPAAGGEHEERYGKSDLHGISRAQGAGHRAQGAGHTVIRSHARRVHTLPMRNSFVTGGTGYIALRLIPELIRRGHTVRALVREGSEKKLPAGAIAVRGNALDVSTFAHQVAPSDTFVQLVGVAHPSP